MIDITTPPPSAEQIREIRRKVADAMTPGTKTMLFCPIPIVDVVAGLAVGAVDGIVNGDREEPWRDKQGAAARDWSGDAAAERYVAAVRDMGRELVNAEVEALEGHDRITRMARHIGVSLADGVMDAVSRRVGTVRMPGRDERDA